MKFSSSSQKNYSMLLLIPTVHAIRYGGKKKAEKKRQKEEIHLYKCESNLQNLFQLIAICKFLFFPFFLSSFFIHPPIHSHEMDYFCVPFKYTLIFPYENSYGLQFCGYFLPCVWILITVGVFFYVGFGLVRI